MNSPLTSLYEFSNIPLEHTPDPQPTVYEGVPFICGFGDAWGMLQGYVGVLLESPGMILQVGKMLNSLKSSGC